MRIMILKMMSRQRLGGTESEQNVKWEGGERGAFVGFTKQGIGKNN